ncbi:ATP-dependent helicase [Hippea jasoniae]|uniref:ATP-dependent helicase n=1 Tax=Hippea jasoniae TaxID=944479 RepID=UPI00054D8235|nr:UvrD-helicase domain-containing protein [Hippea jasoniae]
MTQQSNSIIEALNEQQKAAVLENGCNLLIIAGAGSGKTKTLTHKIAYILDSGLAKPFQIMALTFTNKAANEMKERIVKLVGSDANQMWIGTFHSIALRLLRNEGYRYVIYDTKDQENLLKEVLKQLNIDPKKFTPKKILSAISSYKLNLIKPDQLPVDSIYEKTLKKIYKTYEEKLESSEAVDFDNIIIKTIELLEENPQVREKYAQRFKYIFIDEYQDTNYPQYLFVKLLHNKNNIVCAVGDEDQSIYSFRGAQIENILRFDKEYENCKIIKLEKNYRSAIEILNIANKLIAKNTKRNKKNLYSEKNGGNISIINLPTDTDEAYFVAEKILKLSKQGENLNEIAVLYRTNRQSRAIEEALIKYAIPYQIIGSHRFLERKEIKDILAYLRLLINKKDDISFLRAIGSHPRGIGAKFIEKIKQEAKNRELSLFETSKLLIEENKLSNRQKNALNDFLSIFETIDTTQRVDKIIDEIAQKSGYKNYLEQNSDFDRMGNVEELKNAGNLENLDDFLESLSLLDYSNDLEKGSEHVKLMTIHAAKGLEFNTVFIVGVEEGLFPNGNLKIDENDIEEERRLFYVAITRAKTNLFISHASARKINNAYQGCMPSRFLKEIDVKQKTKDIKRGDRVLHKLFGEGVVLSKDNDMLSINFNGSIKKVLVRDFNLTVI